MKEVHWILKMQMGGDKQNRVKMNQMKAHVSWHWVYSWRTTEWWWSIQLGGFSDLFKKCLQDKLKNKNDESVGLSPFLLEMSTVICLSRAPHWTLEYDS